MKKHCCKVTGCGKAFSRPSHLQRHAVNHSTAEWVCERCNACFKRLDLLGRHKARHVSRDRKAGGDGLGILDTKRKHLRHMRSRAASEGGSVQSQQSQQSRSRSQALLSPLSSGPHDTGTARISHDNGDTHTSSPSQTDFFDPQLSFTHTTQSSAMNNILDQSPGIFEIGNMYHDLTFDLVHFNVTGFATQHNEVPSRPDPLDPLESSSNQAADQYLSSAHVRGHDEAARQMQSAIPTAAGNLNSDEATSQHLDVHGGALIRPTQNETDPHESHGRRGQTSNPEGGFIRRTGPVAISQEKREELLEFIAEMRPVCPDGTLIDGDSQDFSLENMQTYLDLFLEYFNTSYPLLHVPTLEMSELDPIALLSFIILGATYKDKSAHQLSVCLYDAIIPYILSGLLSSPVPDLSILQAFLVLECYGMYRAGPYQRENAILIHCLLLNSIRRISRYHVRARITLPDRLTHKERDWMEFAYAEQYKRLILFFFIWDTQNATCYSFMPNMSTQSLHIGLPCSSVLWEAGNESEWRDLLTEHEESYTLLTLVKQFVNTEHKMLSKPYDMLTFTLALHGLMSTCNDIILFDNRAIYLGELNDEDSSWSPGRQQMAYALSSWKAKYDAFAMETISQITEPLHSDFQRDGVALFALYHTAHIVLNCEIRHLQTAAGAKAIFGHVVTPSDYEDSCEWVRQWVKNSPDSAGRAAWHAAQLFRDGMLNLKDWEVHGAFHYPWCLYIGTLTCWAFHHFGAEASSMKPLCDHLGLEKAKELQKSSRRSMNYLVASMASVTPAYQDGLKGKCCTHGLAIEMAKYLRGVRWTAAYEAMKILEGLSGIPTDSDWTPA
ncbi:hypothetical protein DL98DRAFT_468144 [Cadophora sp. DSE1049]|nr:hypothetical protein DL98DRAFT_468144 [Cadophora sp. DSE1049]